MSFEGSENQFNSSFIMPSWWVHGYEVLSKASMGEDVNLWSLAKKSKCLPFTDIKELDVLVPVFSEIQSQIFQDDFDGKVLLNPTELTKHYGLQGKNSQAIFEKTALSMSRLSILAFNQSTRSWNQVPVFKSETWLEDASQNIIQLELNDESTELINGFLNPYGELKRLYDGQLRLESLFNDRPPLSLWKSAWLELGGLEQLILFSMEKAYQWEKKCTHLDGTILDDFEWLISSDLDQKIMSRYGRKVEGNSLFYAKLKMLTRIGVKLIEHGYLHQEIEEYFLPKNNMITNKLGVSWQLSMERLLASEVQEHKTKMTKLINNNESIPKFLFSVLLGLNVSPQLKRRFDSILTYVNSEDCHLDVPFNDNRVQVFPILLLFLEWSLRAEHNSTIPLPESIQATPAGQLASFNVSVEEYVDNFKAFSDEISTSRVYGELIEKEPLVSVASSLSLKSQKVLNAFAELKGKGGFRDQKNALKAVKQAPVEKTTEINRESDATATGFSASKAKIRKVAAGELQKMIAASPEQYKELREKYFSTLEDTQKQLIVEVRKQMQPAAFEEHLKRKLVSYMVDHPAEWSSFGKSQSIN